MYCRRSTNLEFGSRDFRTELSSEVLSVKLIDALFSASLGESSALLPKLGKLPVSGEKSNFGIKSGINLFRIDNICYLTDNITLAFGKMALYILTNFVG